MASPSVPSISRLETSSESSSDSTSTTTSTASEHSKTNIINRYSCSVERVLYWYPRAYGYATGFGGLTWGQDYKEKHKLDSKQIWNSPC